VVAPPGAGGNLGAMRHLVAISDIHLSEVEPGSGLWMRYRQKEYAPSVEIAAMLDELLLRVRGDELTLVLNGDVFDFDAPRVRSGRSQHHDDPRDAEHAVPMVKAILRDHPEIVRGLARVIAEGHKVVLVSGNHDVQLTLPEVRAVVRDVLVQAALELGAGAAPGELARRIEHYAWFYRTEEGVVFEHGHQYDSFCSFRYPMAPYGRKKGLIQPTLGSMVSRLYMGRLGYFNPHVDATFMLSLAGYARHWVKYYMLSSRSQAWVWLHGALLTMHSLLAHRDPGDRARHAENLAAASAETGAPPRAVASHARLCAPPGEDVLWTCVRELWLDRAIFAGAAAGCAAVWLLSQRHTFGVLATLGPVAMAAVELSKPKSSLEENWRRVQRRARQVAKVHEARAVVFGHTHTPEGVWEGGVFYGNTGSWSAAYRDVACREPLFEERPLVWLRSEGGALSGGLSAWKSGSFKEAMPGPAP
jgi:UDP-2,3-diacylglucosamine pyrophosphatase LpxH